MRLAPRLRAPLLALAAALPLLGGCSDPTGPGLDLALARARWERSEPPAYRLTLRTLCFCAVTEPVAIVVRDGVVEQVTVVATGEALVAAYAPAYTVEDLFGIIERAIAERAVQVEADFDPERGFPTRIVIDGRREIADDELAVLVSALAPL